MSDDGKRRKELLEETRRMYGRAKTPPAVHPRYRAVYSELYPESGEGRQQGGSFGIRLFTAVLLFALFLSAEEQKFTVWNVNSTDIVAAIEKDTGYGDWIKKTVQFD